MTDEIGSLASAGVDKRVRELAAETRFDQREIYTRLVRLGLSDVDQLGIEALETADALET